MSRDLQTTLDRIVRDFGADSGTIHFLGSDGLLHLIAYTDGMPPPVVAIIKTIPVGKGMAGLAAERKQPVTACNIQTDTSGDVRPGAKATGMEGAIVIPILSDAGAVLGTLGVANRAERTFTPDEIKSLTAESRGLAKVAS